MQKKLFAFLIVCIGIASARTLVDPDCVTDDGSYKVEVELKSEQNLATTEDPCVLCEQKKASTGVVVPAPAIQAPLVLTTSTFTNEPNFVSATSFVQVQQNLQQQRLEETHLREQEAQLKEIQLQQERFEQEQLEKQKLELKVLEESALKAQELAIQQQNLELEQQKLDLLKEPCEEEQKVETPVVQTTFEAPIVVPQTFHYESSYQYQPLTVVQRVEEQRLTLPETPVVQTIVKQEPTALELEQLERQKLELKTIEQEQLRTQEIAVEQQKLQLAELEKQQIRLQQEPVVETVQPSVSVLKTEEPCVETVQTGFVQTGVPTTGYYYQYAVEQPTFNRVETPVVQSVVRAPLALPTPLELEQLEKQKLELKAIEDEHLRAQELAIQQQKLQLVELEKQQIELQNTKAVETPVVEQTFQYNTVQQVVEPTTVKRVEEPCVTETPVVQTVVRTEEVRAPIALPTALELEQLEKQKLELKAIEAEHLKAQELAIEQQKLQLVELEKKQIELQNTPVVQASAVKIEAPVVPQTIVPQTFSYQVVQEPTFIEKKVAEPCVEETPKIRTETIVPAVSNVLRTETVVRPVQQIIRTEPTYVKTIPQYYYGEQFIQPRFEVPQAQSLLVKTEETKTGNSLIINDPLFRKELVNPPVQNIVRSSGRYLAQTPGSLHVVGSGAGRLTDPCDPVLGANVVISK
ncbi:uncharacterized abhydrolase domain-containing protein DDB_G0269086-like [Culicoides brevitarsis]|uniref:uncharacterized abhydrolase domain-containing protein DDB_G0269086-like n=1 Tax=Culicoides brevitarsis TaxID=469753 RepID=UPI00307B806B